MPKFDVMIPQEKIAQRVREMGAKITKEYAGKPIVVIGVLKGSFLFRSMNWCLTAPHLPCQGMGV